jgi:hypothetical protein
MQYKTARTQGEKPCAQLTSTGTGRVRRGSSVLIGEWHVETLSESQSLLFSTKSLTNNLSCCVHGQMMSCGSYLTDDQIQFWDGVNHRLKLLNWLLRFWYHGKISTVDSASRPDNGI